MYQPTNTIVTNVRAGDAVSFPRPSEDYSDNPAGTFKPGELLTAVKTWWHRETNRYVVQLDREHNDAMLAFDLGQLDTVKLHARRRCESPTAVYQVGQRVRVNWMHRVNELGVVTEVTYLPSATPGLPGEYCYTAKTTYGDSWIGSENISSEPSPAPAIGQRWVCLMGKHKGAVMTVLNVVDPITAQCRNEMTGRVNRILLSAQWYGITVASAPEPVGELGVDYYEAMVEVFEGPDQEPVSRLVRIF